MCGICGILNLRDPQPVRWETIGRMNAVMRHRGPDEEGFYLNGPVGLGHRRLSIIDLATGRQPVFNEDGSICVVLNGEIYNYKELKATLESKGHRFRSASDTETIVHAYEEYGERCLEEFRGMFSFALWDAKERKLFAARDRLGKKPFYYHLSGERLIFASEVKSILRSGLVKAGVEEACLDQFLSLGYVIAPDTLFKGVKKLLPGQYLTVCGGRVSMKEYWSLDRQAPGELSFSEYQENLVRLLKESVAYRMISDVPLGAFLSGGIDSSIIVGLMSTLSAKPVKTFSVGYRHQDNVSELKYARQVARHFGTDHHEILLDPVDFYDVIPKMVWHADEPIGDQANIPLWLLSREARKHVTVLLSGEGSDELFAGYEGYALMKGIDHYSRLPGWLRSVTDPLVVAAFGERRGRKYVEWSRLPADERYLGDMADLSLSVRKRLYSGSLFGIASARPLSALTRPFYNAAAGADILARMQYLDVKTWLVEDLLLKADKMTMAASVELRCPFLDHRFVEFSQTVPSRYKLKGLTTKYILKKTFEGFLPDGILYRKKEGFPVPLAAWFRGDLNTVVGDVLLDSRSLARGYFRREFIREIVRKQRDRVEDYSKLLWSLLVLEFWHRTYIDGSCQLSAFSHQLTATTLQATSHRLPA